MKFEYFVSFVLHWLKEREIYEMYIPINHKCDIIICWIFICINFITIHSRFCKLASIITKIRAIVIRTCEKTKNKYLRIEFANIDCDVTRMPNNNRCYVFFNLMTNSVNVFIIYLSDPIIFLEFQFENDIQIVISKLYSIQQFAFMEFYFVSSAHIFKNTNDRQ